MLSDVIEYLACPVCRLGLRLGRTAVPAVRCGSGHAFDVARQGYVSLLAGKAPSAETPEMVAAREAFLAAGHFAPLATALVERAGKPDGLILDAGAGTGYYLAAVLGSGRSAPGLALDSAKHALRRAARCHPRAGAAVCDLWQPLPVRTASAEVILNVFAPRNGPEFHRVLRPDGTLIIVTPTGRHLAELISELGLLTVDDDKEARVAKSLGDHFRLDDQAELDLELHLTASEITNLIGMGPNAWHGVPAPSGDRDVTASFRVATYRRRP